MKYIVFISGDTDCSQNAFHTDSQIHRKSVSAKPGSSLVDSQRQRKPTVNFAYNDIRRGIKKCPYSRSVVIPEVSLCVLQLEGTLLWAWKFCRYSRIVVISAVVISEVDCI